MYRDHEYIPKKIACFYAIEKWVSLISRVLKLLISSTISSYQSPKTIKGKKGQKQANKTKECRSSSLNSSAKKPTTGSGNENDPMQRSGDILSPDHMAESAGARQKGRSPSHVVAGRAYESCEGSFHPFAFHTADPYQRIRHGRSPRI